MSQLNPETVPAVALDFMNHDHHEAVALINQIYHLIEQENCEQLTTELEAFHKHNREHFAREEEQMVTFQFPPYDCHKGEHERVLNEMEGAIAVWYQDQDMNFLKDYIDNTVVPWFLNHINTMDTVTAMYLRQQGFQG